MIRNLCIRLGNLHRFTIFSLLFLAVLLPMLYPIELPIIPGKPAKALFSFIEALPAGTRIYLSFDYDPGSMPEIHPAAIAVLTQAFRRGLRPICGGNWPVAGEMADQAIASAVSFLGLNAPAPGNSPARKPPEKGIDYAMVGFRPGGLVNIKRLSRDFLGTYATDRDGTPTRDQPIFQNADGKAFSAQDFGIIVSFSGGALGIEDFISLAGEHGRPLGTACTSINVPLFYTFFQTRQLVGLTGGMPGAAEYEMLVGYRGGAREGMIPQSFAHLAILLFILFGNLGRLAPSPGRPTTAAAVATIATGVGQ
jgi:hypothetical protein